MAIQPGTAIKAGYGVKIKDGLTSKFQNACGFAQEARPDGAWEVVLLQDQAGTIFNPPLTVVISSQALEIL
jgi:hypothetical protein